MLSEDHKSFEACVRNAQDSPPVGDIGATATLQPGYAAPSRDPPMLRPAAPFLMHLIATAQGAPQTRARRRLAPDQAVAAYAAAMQKAPTPAGRGFARSR